MSVETYNPNEVAKVKHLIALAESIAEKFDGGSGETATVDTRPVPTFELFEQDYVTPLTNNQLNITSNSNNAFGFKCNSDGTIYVPTLASRVNIYWRDAEDSNGVKGFVVNPGTNFEVGDSFDVVIKTEETENFKAGSVTLHVTVTA